MNTLTWRCMIIALMGLFIPQKMIAFSGFEKESMSNWTSILTKAQKENKLILLYFHFSNDTAVSHEDLLQHELVHNNALKKEFSQLYQAYSIDFVSDSLARRMIVKYGLLRQQWAVFVPQGELLLSFTTTNSIDAKIMMQLLKEIDQMPFPSRPGFPKGFQQAFHPVIEKFLNRDFSSSAELEKQVKQQLESIDMKSVHWFQFAINFPQWVNIKQLNAVAENIQYYNLMYGADRVKEFLLIAAQTQPKPQKVPDGNYQHPLE